MPNLYPRSLLVALALASHGYRSGSLSPSGALAAAVLGYLTLGNPSRIFGAALIAFYLSGSRVTKVKAEYKATLEDQGAAPPPPGRDEVLLKAGGNRNASQVMCNGLAGMLCAVAYRFGYGGRESILAAVAFWASCAGDTFASELGILSKTRPLMITTLQPCPPGTNGGVSRLGLAVSLLGGLLIGVVSYIVSLLGEGHEGVGYDLVILGGVSGLGGSLLDSLLGATLQRTFFDPTSKKVILHPSPEMQVKLKSVGASRGVLSNDGVNFVTGIVVAVFVWAGSRSRWW